jgi:hypothetical protein
MVAGKVDQDAREVATKRAKTFPTYFFPVGEDIRAIVAEWVDFLRHKKLWGDDDPLFPATEVGIGETGRFGPVAASRADIGRMPRPFARSLRTPLMRGASLRPTRTVSATRWSRSPISSSFRRRNSRFGARTSVTKAY